MSLFSLIKLTHAELIALLNCNTFRNYSGFSESIMASDFLLKLIDGFLIFHLKFHHVHIRNIYYDKKKLFKAKLASYTVCCFQIFSNF